MFILTVVLIILGWGSYFLFRDTMNRIQYLRWLGIYWITRDTGVKGSPIAKRAFMRQTHSPYWRGEGIEFRFRQLTFQVGRLTMRVDNLDAQLGFRLLDTPVKQIRSW